VSTLAMLPSCLLETNLQRLCFSGVPGVVLKKSLRMRTNVRLAAASSDIRFSKQGRVAIAQQKRRFLRAGQNHWRNRLASREFPSGNLRLKQQYHPFG
jgi:hypothetical protein